MIWIRKGLQTRPLWVFNGQDRILFSFTSSFTTSCLLPFLRPNVRGNDPTADSLSSPANTCASPAITPPCHVSDCSVVLCQIQAAASAPVFRPNCVGASYLHTLLFVTFLGEDEGTPSGDEGQVLVLTDSCSPLPYKDVLTWKGRKIIQ